MSTVAALPIAVTAEAATWVRARQREGDLDRMIDHVNQTLPAGRHIDVRLDYDPEDPTEEPLVLIRVFREDTGVPDHATQHAWDDWVLGSFGSDRDFPFVLMLAYETNHAG